ncbi:MAG: hypothetical protein DSZ29_07705 [Aquificaceae bacterium]|nr:MAG: hypothetical protein DSZ29_07705 [Aquificaceae bacterium]
MRNVLPKLFLSCFIITSTVATAEEMDHSKHMMNMQHTASQAPKNPSNTILKEAGNDVFGTIQEAIKQLDANPNTNWAKVDLEALRQHLIDMKNFTVDVAILSQKNTPKGTNIVIKATTDAAKKSLARAMAAHPAMLKAETGWTMKAKAEEDKFILDISTEKPAEVARLRALGYIGVMALGNHHQIHHWMMASGNNPHGTHMQH